MVQNMSQGPMMWNAPGLSNTWMNDMMTNPDLMKEWENSMMKNPQFMNKWMTELMSNSDFRQQYMGPWFMTQNKEFTNQIMKITDEQNATFYAHPIIKTNMVSIEPDAWQYNKTESYSPIIIQIITGTTVTWINNDSVIHTVTDIGGTFDSDLIQPDSSWKHTFYNEGKYTYFCTIHPWMKGIVIVT
jgi:plastocyanin